MTEKNMTHMFDIFFFYVNYLTQENNKNIDKFKFFLLGEFVNCRLRIIKATCRDNVVKKQQLISLQKDKSYYISICIDRSENVVYNKLR